MNFYVKEKKMHNENIKKMFMDYKYSNKSTCTHIRYLFYKTAELEFQLNKDLYEMNERELESLLRGLKNSSHNMVAVNKSYLSSYLDWATFKEKLNDTGINLLESLPQFQSDNLKNFISKVALEKKYIDVDDLREITDAVALNTQDGVIMQMLFEGIKGTKLAELRNLTINDVKGDILILTDEDGSKREFKPSDKLLQMIKDSYRKTDYNKYFFSNTGKIQSTQTKLRYSKYILRGSVRSSYDNLTQIALYQRFQKLKKEWDETSQITPERVWQSGMFYYAKELVERDGELKEEHMDYLIEKFNTSTREIFRYKLKDLIKENIK